MASRRWEPKECVVERSGKSLDTWKELLGARDEDARERCLEVYKEEKRKVKRCIYQSKKEIQEQLGRKINQDVNGNRKLFWKEVNKVNGGNVENSKLIKDGNRRLVLEEAEVRRIWIKGFNGVRIGNYFGGEPIRRTEVKVRVGKLRMERLQVSMRSQEI